MAKLKEFNRLVAWLKTYAKDYNWDVVVIQDDKKPFDTNRVEVWRDRTRLFDAICQRGSYGYEEGLLETMGTIVDVATLGDTVEGHLSASDVISRIEDVYGRLF